MSAEYEIEFEQALMTTLEGNETLTDLLASSTSIYAKGSDISQAIPQLIYSYSDENAQVYPEADKVTLALTIDIYAVGNDLAAIRKALQDLLDERERADAGLSASPLSMTNWKCKHFRYLRSFRIPTGRRAGDSDSNEIIHQPTEWGVRLYRSA